MSKIKSQKEILLELYQQSLTGKWKSKLPDEMQEVAKSIATHIEKQKGVFTVLLTLGVQKIFDPKQDIRFHQVDMPGGFSGRSIDTKHITPTLKELGLTSMAESGWLTRSLEQNSPYDKDFRGKITGVKDEFLSVCDFFQSNPSEVPLVLKFFLSEAEKIKSKNFIKIKPITKENEITLEKIIYLLRQLISHNYHESGASKFPVIVIYCMYELMTKQLNRYQKCKLSILGSHTASDKTSKTSGDIEIHQDGNLYESFEIKHNITINEHIMNRIFEKIKKFNPQFYYFISTAHEHEIDKNIQNKINSIRKTHGCEVRILNFYSIVRIGLCTINDIDEYVNILSSNVISDNELKISHKSKFKEMIESQS